ncbi:response regulator [Corallococcus exiguus]|uniref:response regulator n=1 Tax=Corallococcus exiguus TaxID=83462 RepID=UPI001472097A|nr:response regulator [Corallococcus exiguus]NNC21186.1 response regulator [Corallococcus exiguus]NRD54903.1 response regulator [Corallococcus exiguus]NRD66068.1 response regulator [Corallococcus exiguus]
MPWWNCILVVDDDLDLLRAYEEALNLDGHEVALARNGFEALRLLRQGLRPALILLDSMMPGMNAWSFRLRQLEDPALASIPVIVLYALDAGARAMNALGVDCFLEKPVDLDVLLGAVATYVRPTGTGAPAGA